MAESSPSKSIGERQRFYLARLCRVRGRYPGAEPLGKRELKGVCF